MTSEEHKKKAEQLMELSNRSANEVQEALVHATLANVPDYLPLLCPHGDPGICMYCMRDSLEGR